MFVVRVSGNLSFKAIKVFYVRVHFWYCLNCFANFRPPLSFFFAVFLCVSWPPRHDSCVYMRSFGLLTQNFLTLIIYVFYEFARKCSWGWGKKGFGEKRVETWKVRAWSEKCPEAHSHEKFWASLYVLKLFNEYVQTFICRNCFWKLFSA